MMESVKNMQENIFFEIMQKVVNFPHPTPNTVMRLALTSAYMNNAADIQADIEEAICAISTCTTPEDIQDIHARCRALHTIPRSLIHQSPI